MRNDEARLGEAGPAPLPGIVVELAEGPLDFDAAWRDLAARASANVFMEPAALNAARAAAPGRVHVLLAWQASSAGRRLVGIWALGEKRLSPLGPRLLGAPPYEYSFVATPVIDDACLDAVAAAFVGAIASDSRLPKVIGLKYLDGEAGAAKAVLTALAARKSAVRILGERSRPYAYRDAGVKASGSTRKKMRQDMNRLSATGTVEIVNDRDPAAVGPAFEAFLALEAASWKGEQGTAILSNPDDATFARALVAALAAEGKASVALLRLDGKPVASQVVLYSGRMAYTWKTSFDATFAKFSPGALLIDRLTEELFAAGIEAIESCSPEGGFLAQLWSGRRQTLDLLVGINGRTPAFAAALLRETGRARLKALYHQIRAIRSRPAKKPA